MPMPQIFAPRPAALGAECAPLEAVLRTLKEGQMIRLEWNRNARGVLPKYGQSLASPLLLLL